MNGLLLYNPSLARAYAVKYCQAGNDCPDGQFSGVAGGVVNTDCTHFMSHVLKSGGVIVPGDGLAQCQSGLCYRVLDMEKWFAEATTRYGNVKRIQWVESRDGDIVFLDGFRWRDLSYDIKHVVMAAGPVAQDGGMIFGHSNERCGNERIDYDPDTKGHFYRIESADGQWTSTDGAKRFSLTISGAGAIKVSEQRTAGGPAPARSLTGAIQPDGTLLLSRPVDDEILKLDFPSATLRAAILAHNPPASTLRLRYVGGAIQATWTGLLVRKKPDSSFQEIVPTAQVPSKEFTFSKV